MIRAGAAVLKGALQARAFFRQVNPDVVIGFGGYPSVPALVAAIIDGRPTVIHEQNAVMGRANRTLAPYVKTVACAFPTLQKAPAKVAGRAQVVGHLGTALDRRDEPVLDGVDGHVVLEEVADVATGEAGE